RRRDRLARAGGGGERGERGRRGEPGGAGEVSLSARAGRRQLMKTFVTGASGHVGANLVRALLDRGVEVKALVRPGVENVALDGLDLERAEGDLRDPDSL